MNNKV